MIRRLAEKVWSTSPNESRIPRTVVLKLKTGDFNILTRSHTPRSLPSSCEELTIIALGLRERVKRGPQQCFRLVGVGVSNFHEPEDGLSQQSLFGECDVQDCPKPRQ
jgi:DNA polymerase-4